MVGIRGGEASAVLRAIHILVLWNFAVTQPVLDLLSRNGEFFVAHRSSALDIVLFILVLCVLSPAVLIAVELTAGLLHRRLGQVLHFGLVAGLIGCTLLPLLKRADELSGSLMAITAGILGLSAAIAYYRFKTIRTAFTALGVAPIVFIAVFLLSADVRAILGAGRASPSVSTSATAATAPVVMVVFDEFNGMSLLDENRQIDASRYPNFAALAREATWYRNATTVSPETAEAVPAILTGRYPTTPRLPIESEYGHSLFTLLQGSHQFNVVETFTQLCPSRLCQPTGGVTTWYDRIVSVLADVAVVYLHVIVPPPWNTELPSLAQGWMNFAAPGTGVPHQLAAWTGDRARRFAYTGDRHLQFLAFVDSIERTSVPSLNFIHILLPHVPYQYLPSGKSYGRTGPLPGLSHELWDHDDTAVVAAHQRYLLQLGFVDTLIGKLIERLKAIEMYDQSLLIITADHGVSFLPGESRRDLRPNNAKSVLPIPLFIKAPRQHHGAVSDRNVETIDVLPTALDLLGIGAPAGLDGGSLVAEFPPERPAKTAWHKGQQSVWEGRFHLRYESLMHRSALFGSGTGVDGLFRLAPYGHLIGRAVADLRRIVPADMSIEIDQERLFEDVHTSGTFVPVHVTGRLLFEQRAQAPTDLAVALNGRLVATTRTTDMVQPGRFSVMLPESAFRKGKNDVDFFILSGHDSELDLRRLQKTGRITWRLEPAPDRQSVVLFRDSEPIAVSQHGMQGVVDYACLGDSLEFTGWAADVAGGRVPDVVVAFVEGSLAYSGPINLTRPDVAAFLGDAVFTDSGFAFDVPAPEVRDARKSRVRLFAASTQRAFELTYSDSCRTAKATGLD